MSELLKVALSLSLSGSLLILFLLLTRPLLKRAVSKRWQYYIWLVVIARLLLPLTPEASLMGALFQDDRQTVAQAPPMDGADTYGTLRPVGGDVPETAGSGDAAASRWTGKAILQNLWVVWLGVAAALLIRKVTVYQSFVCYIKAGRVAVSDIDLLDRLAQVGAEVGVKRPVELYTNSLISSPLLLGVFHPCILLPHAQLPKADFACTVRHELIHCRRRDMLYKWLVHLTVCLHWFNPLVWWMGREIDRACELACDEAVLQGLDPEGRRAYGDTLLRAMGTGGAYKNSLASITLSESAKRLKERLEAIMRFKQKPKWSAILSLFLAIALAMGAAGAGAYAAPAQSDGEPAPVVKGGTSAAKDREAEEESGTADGSAASTQAERFYEAGSVPLFQIAFSRMDEQEQEEWLSKIYADQDMAFAVAAIMLLGEDCEIVQRLAEKSYGDSNIAFFSALAMYMSGDTLEIWLDRALEDGNWAFQSVLFNALDWGDEFDELEEKREQEWAEAQRAEYGAAGVAIDGKNYYFQGQLVNIFLDIRPNKSFYTLNINPEGTVSIKIIRNEKNEITGVAYMTEAEVTELLGDMTDDDDWDDDDWKEPAEGRIWHPQVIPVNLETMTDGEVVWLGEYTLSDGDRIWYDVLAETGNGLQVGFVKPEDTHLNITYYCVNNLRQQDEPLKCAASFTFKPPVKPGTYKLFIKATDGALGNVTGSISIASADAS